MNYGTPSLNDRGFLKLVNALMVSSGLVLLAGIIGLPVGCRRDWSATWPTATGVVSATGLKLSFYKPPHPRWYTPIVCYSYTVDGVPRANTQIEFSLSQNSFTKEDGLAWLNQHYPVGKQVGVYYAPGDPDLAVLKPGAGDYVLLAYCLIYTGILCCMTLWVLQRRAKARIAATLDPPSAAKEPV